MMSFSKKISLVIAIVFVVTMAASFAHAQDASSNGNTATDPAAAAALAGAADLAASGTPNGNDVTSTMNPADPGSYTHVTISLASDLVDLSRTDIEWSVNGKTPTGGTGARTFSVTTGDSGTTTTISIVITDIDGTVINKTISITPNDLTVLWEATDSYVPPFYPGKKLPSKGSLVRIAAIPNFANGSSSNDPTNDVYTWSRNGDVVPAASGFGKDYFDFVQNPVVAGDSISVTVSDIANTESATRDADVSFFNPHVLFYGKNIATGLESPLATSPLELSNTTVALDAVPYYFSAGKNPEVLNFSWTVDGNPVALASGSPKHLIVLKGTSKSQSSNVNLTVSSPTNPFQTAQGALHVDLQSGQ